MTVKPYDHSLLSLSPHLLSFNFFVFIFSSLLSASSVLYFLRLPLYSCTASLFLLLATFFRLSMTFHCFRSFFPPVSIYSYISFFFLFFPLVDICFNMLLLYVLLYSWPLFSFNEFFCFFKSSSLLYFPLFYNPSFIVCEYSHHLIAAMSGFQKEIHVSCTPHAIINATAQLK